MKTLYIKDNGYYRWMKHEYNAVDEWMDGMWGDGPLQVDEHLLIEVTINDAYQESDSRPPMETT